MYIYVALRRKENENGVFRKKPSSNDQLILSA